MTIVMPTIAAGRFKAECLALLDDVARTGEEIVVTKRGRPIARVVPIEAPSQLEGSVTFHVSDEELAGPIDADWKIDR
jgi:prevent-host-death family protein